MSPSQAGQTINSEGKELSCVGIGFGVRKSGQGKSCSETVDDKLGECGSPVLRKAKKRKAVA